MENKEWAIQQIEDILETIKSGENVFFSVATEEEIYGNSPLLKKLEIYYHHALEA